MSELKVGDRVRLVGDDWAKDYDELECGSIVTIDDIDLYGVIWAGEAGSVGRDGELYSSEYPEISGDYRVELVESQGNEAAPAVSLEDIASIAEVAEKFGITSHRKLGDPVERPNYYVFPGGAEVISISQWLTSAGAQAFQYIARATRIDGVVKENPIEDLRKAQYWLNVEIERLEGQE